MADTNSISDADVAPIQNTQQQQADLPEDAFTLDSEKEITVDAINAAAGRMRGTLMLLMVNCEADAPAKWEDVFNVLWGLYRSLDELEVMAAQGIRQ